MNNIIEAALLCSYNYLYKLAVSKSIGRSMCVCVCCMQIHKARSFVRFVSLSERTKNMR